MTTRTLSSLVVVVAASAAVAGGGITLATGATTPTTPTTPSTPTTPTTPGTTPANPTAPTAVTGAPESIGRTTATFTGSVTPGGAATTYRFEYGTSTSYGLKTADTSLPAGSAAVSVKAAATGLIVGTVYHYRVVATNAAGTTRGADKTVTTASAAPKAPGVSTQAATAVTSAAATLMGRVNPQGQATTYLFQYGTSTAYKSKTASVSVGAGTSAVAVTAPISKLSANTKYHYRLVAVNAAGTARTADRTFTTPRVLSGVTIAARPVAVVWGQKTTISGVVAGQGVSGLKVALMRQDFPFATAPVQVATQSIGSGGAYSFTVGPLYAATRVSVMTQTGSPVSSPVFAVQGALLAKLRISARRRTTMQLRVKLHPALPNGRATVQRKTPGGRWIRVKRARLVTSTVANRSIARVTVPRLSRATRYRIVVSPRDGGAHVKTTTKVVVVAARR